MNNSVQTSHEKVSQESAGFLPLKTFQNFDFPLSSINYLLKIMGSTFIFGLNDKILKRRKTGMKWRVFK